MTYDSFIDAVMDGEIDPCEALGRWLDGQDAREWDEERQNDEE